MDLLYHSTASNTILGSLVTREQCVAYIPMPKGRGITPRVIKEYSFDEYSISSSVFSLCYRHTKKKRRL